MYIGKHNKILDDWFVCWLLCPHSDLNQSGHLCKYTYIHMHIYDSLFCIIQTVSAMDNSSEKLANPGSNTSRLCGIPHIWWSESTFTEVHYETWKVRSCINFESFKRKFSYQNVKGTTWMTLYKNNGHFTRWTMYRYVISNYSGNGLFSVRCQRNGWQTQPLTLYETNTGDRVFCTLENIPLLPRNNTLMVCTGTTVSLCLGGHCM